MSKTFVPLWKNYLSWKRDVARLIDNFEMTVFLEANWLGTTECTLSYKDEPIHPSYFNCIYELRGARLDSDGEMSGGQFIRWTVFKDRLKKQWEAEESKDLVLQTEDEREPTTIITYANLNTLAVGKGAQAIYIRLKNANNTNSEINYEDLQKQEGAPRPIIGTVDHTSRSALLTEPKNFIKSVMNFLFGKKR
jgi:hypothetical protein